MNFKSTLIVFSAAVIGLSAATSTWAVTNPSFESKVKNTWDTSGKANRSGKFRQVSPTDGKKQMILRSGHRKSSSVADLESFVGVDLDAAIGATVVDGSAIAQTFTVTEDSALSFDFALGRKAGKTVGGNDTAFAVIDGQFFSLSDLNSTVFTTTARGGKWGHGAYSSFSGLPTLAAGEHTIYVGIAGVDSGEELSTLLLDNFVLSAAAPATDGEGEGGGGTDGEVIPEPVTAGLTMLSMGALAAVATRRRREEE